MNTFEKIAGKAKELGFPAVLNAPMKEYTSFRIGGPASLLLVPDNLENTVLMLKLCKEYELPYFFLGNGSNLLVSDEGYAGVMFNTVGLNKCRLSDGAGIECEAGTSLNYLCKFALNSNLTGLEFAYGIPGTAGGAAYMNAGAYGGEMKDVITRCEHLDDSFEQGCFSIDELQAGYRKSVYSSNGYLITKIHLRLNKGSHDEIAGKMSEILDLRKKKQPLEYPSAGSTFKRPEGDYAGRLIETCGLKGLKVGGAEVSTKHAGFIINTGNALCDDVKRLIEIIQEKVYKETSVMLETEIKYL